MNTNIFNIGEEDDLALSEDFLADFDEPASIRNAPSREKTNENSIPTESSFQSPNRKGSAKIGKFTFKSKTSPGFACGPVKSTGVLNNSEPTNQDNNTPCRNTKQFSTVKDATSNSSSQRLVLVSNLSHLQGKENVEKTTVARQGNVEEPFSLETNKNNFVCNVQDPTSHNQCNAQISTTVSSAARGSGSSQFISHGVKNSASNFLSPSPISHGFQAFEPAGKHIAQTHADHDKNQTMDNIHQATQISHLKSPALIHKPSTNSTFQFATNRVISSPNAAQQPIISPTSSPEIRSSHSLRPINQFTPKPVGARPCQIQSQFQQAKVSSNVHPSSVSDFGPGQSPVSRPFRPPSTGGQGFISPNFVRPMGPSSNHGSNFSPHPVNFRPRTPGGNFRPQFSRFSSPTNNAFSSIGGNAPFRQQGPIRHATPSSHRLQTPVRQGGTSNNCPVLTPGVAQQLCQNPSGAGSGGPSRSKRKFPGPAGILPKLVSGQKIPDASLAIDKEKEREKEKNTQEDMSSQDVTVDDFSTGAWKTMKAELGIKDGDQNSILAKYNIGHVFRRASLKQLSRNKVPQMCVMIKSITINATDASVTLKDPTGEMVGTLHRRLVEEHQVDLKPGTVLVLQKVGVLSPSLRNHYLNVTLNNIVQIFPSEHQGSQKTPKSHKTSNRTSDFSPTSPLGVTTPSREQQTPSRGKHSPSSTKDDSSNDAKSVRTNLLDDLLAENDDGDEVNGTPRKAEKRDNDNIIYNPSKKHCAEKGMDGDPGEEKQPPDPEDQKTEDQEKTNMNDTEAVGNDQSEGGNQGTDGEIDRVKLGMSKPTLGGRNEPNEESIKSKDAEELSEGSIPGGSSRKMSGEGIGVKENLAALIEGFEDEIFADF